MAGWTDNVSHIRAVLFEEDGSWSAQCLDYDIAAQAKTLLDLADEIARVLVVHIAASMQMGREPFAGIKPAPKRFWDLYQRGLRIESRPVPWRLEKGPQLPPIQPELRIARSRAV
jgi:hypothetical protein